MKRKTTPAQDRFFAKVDKTDTCWLWTASTRGHGYGQFWDGERHTDAHRFSYKFHKGEIPKGQVVMHLCDIAACVNPAHLELGTQRDNLRDMYAKGRHRAIETYKQQSGALHWTKRMEHANV